MGGEKGGQKSKKEGRINNFYLRGRSGLRVRARAEEGFAFNKGKMKGGSVKLPAAKGGNNYPDL